MAKMHDITTGDVEITRKIDENFKNMYEVGDIFISVNSADPALRFGGTWERFANGRVLVGVDEADTALNASQKTGGSVNPLTAHSHSGTTSSNGAHAHTVQQRLSSLGSGGFLGVPAGTNVGWGTNNNTNNTGAHTHTMTTNSQGSNTNHANWQPFATVYMWVRTA